MRYLFSAMIILHGAIHLLGFVKAYDLAQIKQLSVDISKLSGLIWLLVFVLFVVSGIAYQTKNQWWSVVAIIAVVLSTILSILVWKDTKFASIPNIMILFVAVLSLSQAFFDKKVSNEIAQIITTREVQNHPIISLENLVGLPSPVEKWLKVSGIVGKEKINTVWLSQKAKMKIKPEQENWTKATAEQHFNIQEPAFIWNVKMNMPPFIKIAGRDKFIDGKGEMQIKMFSLVNIVNEKGPKMDEGTLQRYLGEIVWFPSASLSPYISWEEIDKFSAKATMIYKGTKGSGTFHFNEKGDFIQYRALRYKGNEPDAKRYEWVIKVKEHAIMNGIKIPVKLTATWKLNEADWTWLNLEIKDINYNFN